MNILTLDNSKKNLHILGTRGIPARHGGFETFAHNLSLYLTQRGWNVTVYCQTDGTGKVQTTIWNGITLITIPVKMAGAAGTMIFDWKAARIAGKRHGLHLVLGYNTAIFNAVLKPKKAALIFNMDGLEWRREKWSATAKTWLYINERIACITANHLIADHPEIQKHLMTRSSKDKITMIPYGAPSIEKAPADHVIKYGLEPEKYMLLIARPEPENMILEIVKGFSSKKRPFKLMILGDYSRSHSYQATILDAANDDVCFAGAIYDQEIVASLRFHAMAYIHGHTVGGTNPSLVEAMGAGNAIIAHDNPFNRWVTGNDAALFFLSEQDFAYLLDKIVQNTTILKDMRNASRARFKRNFTWPAILNQYENCLKRFITYPA